ncbi:MAG: helix-hairpin-helix domain-containing protein [Anaerolineales bacterium]
MQVKNVGPHERVIQHQVRLPGEIFELHEALMSGIQARFPNEFEAVRGATRFEVGAERRPAEGFERRPIALTTLNGVGPATAKRLREAGIAGAQDLQGADLEGLAQVTGISLESLEEWRQQAQDLEEAEG